MNFSSSAQFERIPVFGVSFTKTDKPSVLSFLKSVLSLGEKKNVFVTHINAHGLYIALQNENYRNILNSSNLIFCDGFGPIFFSRILGKSVGKRMATVDWTSDLLDICRDNNQRVFFLGDEDYVLDNMIEYVNKKHPGLQVSGKHNGFFNRTGAENDAVISLINDSNTGLLFVGMGMPIQEEWIFKNKERLNVKVIISVGAMYRWYSGIDKRAPKWVTDNGFEWLHRLIIQPKLVWRRYLLELPALFFITLKLRFFPSSR
jgi:N-acetylglucosaminyldiphosphoundecaprenol N-acetyl-beta-D-mannosaminyltransferase